MAPRKGLSFEEKRDRLIELFAETADFFTLKELEKLAQKRKGIVSQTVKEVLQSLVDDNLVNTDKCGVQTVFWALPSEASQKKKAKLGSLQEQVKQAEKDESALGKELDELKQGREESEERTEVLQRIETLEGKVKKLDAELARFAEFDPEEIEQTKAQTVKMKQAVNRWVDNVFNVQSWIVRTFGMDKREFSAQFDIPEDLDYVE